MFDATQITSEVEAVNLMLSMIGVSPVNSLGAAAINPDVQLALMHLRTQTRFALQMEWTFNRDENVVLTPDGNGKIAPPSNAIRATPYVSPDFPAMREVKWTLRGDAGVLRLWDSKRLTFVWSQPVRATILYLYSWENIPEPVRVYILTRAGRVFLGRHDGDNTRFKITEKDEAEALALCSDYEIDDSNNNFLNDSPDVTDGWAVGR